MALAALGLAVAAPAQSPPQAHVTLGATTVDAPHFKLVGTDAVLFGGVTVTSTNYDMKADEVKVFGVPAKSGSPAAVSKITAEGDPAHGTQVTGHFNQLDLGRTYTMQADHAVYVPDSSRPGGGRLDFTGHAKMTVRAPDALAGPSVTTAEHITVLLGQGADYPQIEGENGHMTFTPLAITPMPILSAHNLKKSYKGRTVVDDVSVEIHQGEIVGLLGTNGAGKTTSFYMMVGLVRPDGGRVMLDGKDITRLPMYQRARHGLGYLAQEPSAFRKLTTAENIMLVLEMQPEAVPQAARRAARRIAGGTGPDPAPQRARADPLRRRAAARGDRPRPGDPPGLHSARRAVHRD